jgi:AcrR family transcriptional regulator
MPSQRHSTRVGDDVLLDAAHKCVLLVGVRRTTLTDVAREAGVSRMTLYRRFPDVRSLVAALMTREFGALLGEVGPGETARQRLVSGAVGTVRRLLANPLMAAVLDRDAELLLPYVVERLGATQLIAEQFLRLELVAGHADGSIRRGDLDVQARTLLLMVQSFVLSVRPAVADLDPDAVFDELALMVEGALRP